MDKTQPGDMMIKSQNLLMKGIEIHPFKSWLFKDGDAKYFDAKYCIATGFQKGVSLLFRPIQ